MSPIAYLIIGVEIGFWLCTITGLAVRYLLNRPRLGLVLLAMTAVLDLVLLVATTYDVLVNGTVATLAHGIAAVYLSISVTFGKRLVRWADERFRYYVLKTGARPVQLYGREHARYNLQGSLLYLLAWLLGGGYLFLLIHLVGDPVRTNALAAVLRVWTVSVIIDLLIAASYFIWPRQPQPAPAPQAPPAQPGRRAGRRKPAAG